MHDDHDVSVRSSLRILFEDGTVTGLSDARLLERFVSRRDESAFAALVERHGPMVLRVCHEVSRDHHDAQDAFQATFLVLARHARSIRQRASLASWLHGVSLRIAASARSASARRRTHEYHWAVGRAMSGPQSPEALTDREELGRVVHSEIGRLPERIRATVVLCYLEGRTYEEAARVLRCPVGTIKSRLSNGRERLRRRLKHLTQMPSAGSAGLVLGAIPPVLRDPAPLPESVLQAVVRHACGGTAPATISGLAQGVLKSMVWHRLIYATGAFVLILIGTAALATGTIGLGRIEHDILGSGGHETIVPAADASQRPQTPLEDGDAPKIVHDPTGKAITLTGRILDDHGTAVPGAIVRFRLFQSRIPILRIASELIAIGEGKTDNDGRYRIQNLRGNAGSEYQHLAMDVNASGFVEFIEFYFAGFAQIIQAGGAVSDVRLERGDLVTGRCVGPDGIIEPGARIRSGFAGRPMSSLGRARAVDAEGRFRLAIPHGLAAELIIYPERRDSPAGAGPIVRKSDTKQRIPRRVKVAAGGGDLGDVRLDEGREMAMSAPSVLPSMIGRPESATDRGSFIRVPGGWQPVGQLFAIESGDRGDFGWFPITLTCATDRDRLLRIPPLNGPYKIWPTQAHDSGVDDRGPIRGELPPIPVMPEDVEPGRMPNLQVRHPVAVRGKVTGADGKPAPGVALMLLAAIGGAQDNRLTTLQWTTTNAEGHYTLTGIPQGLTRAHLNVYAEPPDRRSHYEALASGNFLGTAVISSVSFDTLNRDQDPLDFHLKLVKD